MKRSILLIVAIFAASGLLTAVHAADDESKIAFGIGLPYGGGVGVDFEYGVTDHVAPMFGQGWVPENFG